LILCCKDMNKKLFCLFVLCLLAISAFAEMELPHRRHMKSREGRRHHHFDEHDHPHHPPHPRPPFESGSEHPHPPHPRPPHPHDQSNAVEPPPHSHIRDNRQNHFRIPNKKNFVHPVMDKIRENHQKINHVHEKVHNGRMSTTQITPGVTYEQTVDFFNVYTVPFSQGDNIAVHIVRSSDAYNSQTPNLRLCRQLSARCFDDSKNNSLSFELTSSDLARAYRRGSFQFSLSTAGMNMNSAVVVGIYACVGPNASLATCKGEGTKTCVNGKRSDVMNVCICDKGYTGSVCDTEASDPPKTEFYSFEEFDALFDFICGIISFVCSIVFFIILITIISFCCICIRGCCCRHHRRGAVMNRRAVPPPPPYPGGAYHPINVVPPPPPPPMRPPPPPPPMAAPQYYAGNAIEMAVLPASKVPSPVYIMPPLAPVKQVPVFVQPPAAPPVLALLLPQQEPLAVA